MDNGFIKIRRGLHDHLFSGKINGDELAVYVTLHLKADFMTGLCAKISAPYISQFLNKKVHIIKKCLSSLDRKGYIKRFQHRGHIAYYPILINKFLTASSAIIDVSKTMSLKEIHILEYFNPTLNELQTNFKATLNELQKFRIQEVIRSNKNINKNKKNINKNANAVKPTLQDDGNKTITVPDNLNNPLFLNIWEEWKRHRKEINKKLTPTSIKAQLVKLSKWGTERSIDAINNSIEKGYQGIFEENNTSSKKESMQEKYDKLKVERKQKISYYHQCKAESQYPDKLDDIKMEVRKIESELANLEKYL